MYVYAGMVFGIGENEGNTADLIEIYPIQGIVVGKSFSNIAFDFRDDFYDPFHYTPKILALKNH